MFEQTFKNIDDILHKDAGCTSELDYTEQSSWLLFLKYLDALERDKAAEAALEGRGYEFILSSSFRWEVWAAPKGADGRLDHNAALTGDDLRDFVNRHLFPYLAGFKQRASGPNTIEYKIGEVFGEIKNKIQSGYNLRDVIDLVDELRFGSQTEKHELSHLYEAKIRNMGNAGRNGGEYYTPRPLIRAMIKVVAPKIGERIYDGACGSAGFLCEAYDYLLPQATKADDLQTLQTRTFFGKEKKSLAYVIAIMNMILHGIEAPNIVHANTLADNISDIQDRDRFDVVLANPPFGGKERKEVQQNFPIKTGETAFLFLQHFIKTLKAGGRGAIVIKNTFLSNTDNASTSIRKLLLESCHGTRLPRRHLPGCRREDRGAVLRQGRADAPGLVLPVEPGPQPRQDQPAQRRRSERLRRTPAQLCRFAAKLVGGRVQHRREDLGPVGQESERWRRGQATHPAGDSRRDRGAGCGEFGGVGGDSGAAVTRKWKVGTLKDMCVVDWGNTNLTKSAYVEDGEFLAVSAAGCDGRIGHKEHSKRTPVLSAIGAQCGKMFFPEEDFTAIKNTITLTPRPDVCTGKFLYYLLTSIELPQRGAGQPFISKGDIQNFATSFPSLPEQCRIVAILDEAFEGIATAKANAEKNLQNAEELFEVHLELAFLGQETGWACTTLGRAFRTLTGSTPSKANATYFGDFMPLVKPPELLDDVVEDALDGLSQTGASISRVLPVGSVMVSCIGNLGKTGINSVPVACNQQINAILPDETKAVPEFMFFQAMARPFKKQLAKAASGTTVPIVNKSKFNEIQIVLPPHKRQQEIVESLRALRAETDRLAALFDQKLTALEELKKSLLHQAFTGAL